MKLDSMLLDIVNSFVFFYSFLHQLFQLSKIRLFKNLSNQSKLTQDDNEHFGCIIVYLILVFISFRIYRGSLSNYIAIYFYLIILL